MIKKLLFLLVLLLTATTGAWAQSSLTCAEVYAKSKDTELALNDVVVTYVNNKYVYVKDATGYMLLYLTGSSECPSEWTPGTILSNVTGTVDLYNGLYEVKLTSDQLTAVTTTTGDAPAPIEFTAAPVADDMNKYIVLKGVTVSNATFPDNKNMNVTIGEKTFVLRNQFNADVAFDTEKKYDITAVVSYYNTTVQAYFISATEASSSEPATYAVTLAEGTDPNEWTISPTEAAAGATITVTYTGSKKVLGVKAEKKAAASLVYPIALSAVTADYIGSVVTTDGNVYPAKTAVPDGCTAVGILGKVTETGHGLILALQNATDQTWNTINGWTSVTTYAGTTLKLLPDDTARGSLTSYTKLGDTTVSNWAVAQKSDYEAIFTNLGSTTGDEDGMTFDDNVNAYITGVGGTALETDSRAWSISTYDDTRAWQFTGTFWGYGKFGLERNVRPVLGFGEEATPGEAANTWTFTMPAFDVEIAPIYAPVAQWAVVENVQQLPKAIESIYAESTDAIVKAGTVAKIGETENPQGTLMYAVGTSATEQPALTAFSATLPTAEKIAAGVYYVWYYIKGADTPQGQDPTAENTFNDSEICTTPIKVTILSNKFNIQFNAANANTIEAGKATVTVGGTTATVTEGKLEGVKMGTEVKLKAKEGYKFRKVEVKKKAEVLTITVAKGSTDLSGDKLLYYTPGETYRQAIANHPENKLDGGLGWNIWEGGNDATIFYKESTDKSRDLSIDGDQHFRPTDSINLDTVIDPTLNFYFVDPF